MKKPELLQYSIEELQEALNHHRHGDKRTLSEVETDYQPEGQRARGASKLRDAKPTRKESIDFMGKSVSFLIAEL